MAGALAAFCLAGPAAAAPAACDLGLVTPDSLAAAFAGGACRKGDALAFAASGPADRIAALVARFCDLRAQVLAVPGPDAYRTVVCLADPKPLRGG